MSALPSLHKHIRRAFLRVVLLFWGIGMLILAAVWFTGGLPLQLVRLNYDSIVWFSGMDQACDAMLAPSLYPERTLEGWRAFFTENLERAEHNATEREEQAALVRIRAAWEKFQKEAVPNTLAVKAGLRELESISEKSVLRRLDAGLRWRDAVLLIGALALMAVVVAAIFVADAVSARIAHPLRRAAELLRARPVPGRSLALPEPQTLDVRVLFDELTRQWDWLGELDALNVQRLLEEKHKLELILESVEDAILALDAQGRVLLVSRRMLGIVGMPRAEVEGNPWPELVHSGKEEGQDAPGNRKALDLLLNAPARGESEVALKEAGETHAFRTRDRDLIIEGRVAGRLLLLTDVTEKTMRDTLRAEMMDWIGHELKTPIQSLGLAADLLNRQRDGLDESLGMLIDTVRQDTERLRSVARQFMDIAGMTPSMLRLVPERVELGTKLDEWLAPFRLTARESGQGLLFTRNVPVVVNIDAERFAWVLSNLVSNALRETPPGKNVEISLREYADEAGKKYVEMSVEDEGPGIAPELEQRLFRPFSHGLTKGARQGLAGLGLAISCNLVESHGGSLRYTRGARGGACFVVVLPLA